MGHNIKNTTLRANIVVRPIGDFKDWRFVMHCSRCRLTRMMPVAGLVRRYSDAHLVGEVVGRFVCATPRCGSMPSSVHLASRLHRVVLHGPGAFS